MTFIVRLAVEGDAASLPAIERSAAGLFGLDPELAWLADAEVPDAQQHLQAIDEARVWVAQDGTQLAGFVRALPVNDQLHIEELSVSEDFQGRGVGRQLLSTVIAQAREHRFHAVTLTTFRDLPWNAPFYQRLGFSLLCDEQVDTRLAAVLNDERVHGLPVDRRCAMRLVL